MKKNNFFSKKPSLAAIIFVTALTTFAATAFVGWFLGFHPSHRVAATKAAGQKETVWTCGMHPWIMEKEPGTCPICEMKLTPRKEEKKERAGERKVVYWRAPMNPEEIYDSPGKSAMGMDLVPVYEDELVGGVSVSVDPVVQQNMGLRTATVEKGPLTRVIRAYGHVNYDETGIGAVSLKVSGWIEKIYVDFTGKTVKKGEPLFDIYSPELLTAQEEYLTALKSAKSLPNKRDNSSFLKSARRRLKYFDVPEDQIKRLEKSGRAIKALTIRSPFSGVAIARNIELGGYLKAGASAYRIADLSKVWAEARLYEYDLPWIRENQEAEISFPRRDKKYKGKISHIYPYLNPKTREATARLELENPDLSFKPGMYVDVKIKVGGEKEGLIIPAEAVIRSGEKNLVFAVRENNKFVPREIKIGLSLDNHRLQALEGLAPGETIVVSGQFLLDSESKLKEALQKMTDPEPIKNKKEDQDFFDDLEE